MQENLFNFDKQEDLAFKQAEKEHTKLSKKVEKLDIAYYQDDAPLVSDAEYDEIRRSIIRIEEKYPQLTKKTGVTSKVGAKVKSGFKKINHIIPMLSLGNIFAEEEIADFVGKCERFLGIKDIDFFAEPKIETQGPIFDNFEKPSINSAITLNIVHEFEVCVSFQPFS